MNVYFILDFIEFVVDKAKRLKPWIKAVAIIKEVGISHGFRLTWWLLKEPLDMAAFPKPWISSPPSWAAAHSGCWATHRPGRW